MDAVHHRGSMDLVHESGPWTQSKVGVHGPLVHVLSSPRTLVLQWKFPPEMVLTFNIGTKLRKR